MKAARGDKKGTKLKSGKRRTEGGGRGVLQAASGQKGGTRPKGARMRGPRALSTTKARRGTSPRGAGPRGGDRGASRRGRAGRELHRGPAPFPGHRQTGGGEARGRGGTINVGPTGQGHHPGKEAEGRPVAAKGQGFGPRPIFHSARPGVSARRKPGHRIRVSGRVGGASFTKRDRGGGAGPPAGAQETRSAGSTETQVHQRRWR